MLGGTGVTDGCTGQMISRMSNRPFPLAVAQAQRPLPRRVCNGGSSLSLELSLSLPLPRFKGPRPPTFQGTLLLSSRFVSSPAQLRSSVSSYGYISSCRNSLPQQSACACLSPHCTCSLQLLMVPATGVCRSVIRDITTSCLFVDVHSLPKNSTYSSARTDATSARRSSALRTPGEICTSCAQTESAFCHCKICHHE